MSSLDSLPADQRAVLQMVLGRGRGYDDIANMLHIDPADVRRRAVNALDALGPATRVPVERREVISDYLLGQLPDAAADEAREQLARSSTERAWARVVAAELAPLATGTLPEIPTAANGDAPGLAGVASGEPEAPVSGIAKPSEAEPPRIRPDYGLREPQPPPGPRSSRLGGAIVLGVGAAVVIGVVVFLIVSGGSSKKHRLTPATSASTTATSTSRASRSTCNPATSTTACPIHQINLVSPAGNHSTVGIAEVLKKGSQTAIAIVAEGVPANTQHNAYAVWLYNSGTDALRLGFVNPGVGKNGKLQTAGGLPADASRFKYLLVTLETQPTPHSPGQVVLEGQFAE